MAQSRLEKIGTIFTRVSGLLRSEAMKLEDKPIWYDVYAAFPPKLEPRYDRPVPNVPIRNILYEEDIVRAKFHKTAKQPESINLADYKRETQSQQFIGIYNGLKAQGALDEKQIFETAQELLSERRQNTLKSEDNTITSSLSEKFAEAMAARNVEHDDTKTTPVNIQNLFKE